ncbi:hypothetical protein ACHEVM_22375 [Roseomonas sp. SXEYE002]|uniref:hypothetical protein n=1 Tax=Roseomonas xinghualingensis TaxID=2986475 RepID=UPI0021F1FA66|nr:hypothetical protein [Roseomonas sp. SXEYE001]MCV4210055.1 hypothetical protein [Roseomonas sp. SXEYE001]
MSSAFARTLTVGDGTAYPRPSDAARAAQPGDRIQIQPGTYYDCAVWLADGLVIEGSGPETVLTDTICQGKAIFVIVGRGITVQDLVLSRARAQDENGAGIRAEGPNLRVHRVKFENNQNGLLAANLQDSELQIKDCTFVSNGVSNASHQTASLLVGSSGKLSIQDSKFEQDRGQTTILSQATVTEIADSQIATPEGAKGIAIRVSGGLVLERSILEFRREPDASRTALMIFPGDPSLPLIVRNTTLQGSGTLLLNWSGRISTMEENRLDASSILETTSGAWFYRARTNMRQVYDAVRAGARALKRHTGERLPQ